MKQNNYSIYFSSFCILPKQNLEKNKKADKAHKAADRFDRYIVGTNSICGAEYSNCAQPTVIKNLKLQENCGTEPTYNLINSAHGSDLIKGNCEVSAYLCSLVMSLTTAN